MKERDYYITPKSNAVMRFLWKAAGGDKYLLEQATYSDQVKYMCLGELYLLLVQWLGLQEDMDFTQSSPQKLPMFWIKQKH